MDVPPPDGAASGGQTVDPSISGPLSLAQARALLERGDALLADGDFADAGRCYQRVVGYGDPAITGVALLGLGEALFRLDQDDAALQTWESILQLPETPATYPALRNVAAARVRAGDLRGAAAAYRNAERRAPPEDRAEIASRLGWLSKELGDTGASRRYFARARGDSPMVSLTVAIIALTTAISFACFTTAGARDLVPLLELNKFDVANGEYWRLWTVTLVHVSVLHLLFNMYALWLVGPIVERFYGSIVFGLMYLLCAAAGSVASFVFGGDIPSVGASGAIFGLVGVLIAAQRAHDPMVDRRTRSLLGVLVPLVIINFVFDLFFAGSIDIAAHIGGLLAGMWLGWLLVPARVQTMAGHWQLPGGSTARPPAVTALRTLGVLALVVVLVVGIVIGTDARGGRGPGGIVSVGSPGVAGVPAAAVAGGPSVPS